MTKLVNLKMTQPFFQEFSLIFIKIPSEWWIQFNSFTPRSDQYTYLNSPYNINTLSSRQVMRIKKIFNNGILFGYNTKFSGLAKKEMYCHQLGELAFRS